MNFTLDKPAFAVICCAIFCLWYLLCRQISWHLPDNWRHTTGLVVRIICMGGSPLYPLVTFRTEAGTVTGLPRHNPWEPRDMQVGDVTEVYYNNRYPDMFLLGERDSYNIRLELFWMGALLLLIVTGFLFHLRF